MTLRSWQESHADETTTLRHQLEAMASKLHQEAEEHFAANELLKEEADASKGTIAVLQSQISALETTLGMRHQFT